MPAFALNGQQETRCIFISEAHRKLPRVNLDGSDSSGWTIWADRTNGVEVARGAPSETRTATDIICLAPSLVMRRRP